jgi:hypothetical protein
MVAPIAAPTSRLFLDGPNSPPEVVLYPSIALASPGNRFVLGLLGAAFERLVELLESGEGVAVKRGGGKGYQDAAELLLLAEADPAVAERFDGEAVVAVEQAGKQHVAEPAQSPAGVGLQHGGPQSGATAAGRWWRGVA